MCIFSYRRPLCKDFKNGKCIRENCIFLHNYKYCFDFQNTSVCSREKCKFIHATHSEQMAYEGEGCFSLRLKQEICRTRQSANICIDNLNGSCSRQFCKFQHLSITNVVSFLCGVCYKGIPQGKMIGFDKCDHVFCKSCVDQLEFLAFQRTECPLCRTIGKTIELS